MTKINRRNFIKTGVAGVAGLTVASSGIVSMGCSAAPLTVDRVKLGKSGLTVSRIAMGTGTVGYNKSSNQTRQGMEAFVKMAHHAYEKGIRFFDMADGYGSMPFVGEAMKSRPREKVTLLSKIWTYPDGSDRNEPVKNIIDRFLKETSVEYFDILLMHCLTDGNWDKTRTHYMEGFSRAKEAGIVKAVGVSCHNWDAMVTAAESPWVDVIMARINPFGTLMDNTPEKVSELLAKIRKNGKGIVGMKIFGEGKHVSDDEREQSIQYAINAGSIHSMTLGFEKIEHIDDAVERVMRAIKTKK
ncbi:MAG: aldo/keto reductase [Prolixibacteraceae bacterium]|nr:aldo/keto reductase [Prolixibacteraceae bacterium]